MDMTLNNIFINISIVDEKWFISYKYIIELQFSNITLHS